MSESILYMHIGDDLPPVANASLHGFISECNLHEDIFSTILGSKNGVEGLINDDIIVINKHHELHYEQFAQTPGVLLGSSKKLFPKSSDRAYDLIFSTLRKHKINSIIVAGGFFALRSCLFFFEAIKNRGERIRVVCIPESSENDLCGTDHTLGYPSSVLFLLNTIACAVKDLQAYKNGKTLIIEVPGKSNGWLCASTSILDDAERPDVFILPEIAFNEESFIDDVRKVYLQKRRCVIVVAKGEETLGYEHGYRKPNEKRFYCDGSFLEKIVKDKLGYETRIFNLASIQHSSSLILSNVDLEEASMCSKYAVKSILSGQSWCFVGLKRMLSAKYMSEPILIDLKCLSNRNLLPYELLSNRNELFNYLNEYLSPLICDVRTLSYKDGIVSFLSIYNE